LDGFPRTLTQAAALDKALANKGLQVRLAPLLEVSDDAVIGRMAGRRVCRTCQARIFRECQAQTAPTPVMPTLLMPVSHA